MDTSTAHLGYLAAFGTALCWTVSAVYFTRVADRAGGFALNHGRCLFALPFMALLHVATRGQIFPSDVEGYRWGWLALSALLGLVLGDSSLFVAFRMIGARLTLLITALVPIIGTTAAWIFLGERLLPMEVTGVLVAVSGIGWVVMERGNHDAERRKRYGLGILCAVGGSFGQALGLVAAKKGMAGDFPAISATLVRMVSATVVLWGFTLIRGQAFSTFRKLIERENLIPLLIAVVLGAALGIWLSLISVQYARLGIATTIMSLPPVLILPLAKWQMGETITARAVLGTIVAFAGIAILLLG